MRGDTRHDVDVRAGAPLLAAKHRNQQHLFGDVPRQALLLSVGGKADVDVGDGVLVQIGAHQILLRVITQRGQYVQGRGVDGVQVQGHSQTLLPAIGDQPSAKG